MQTTTPDLAPAAAEVARVVAGVRDDQLTDPTPCTGTSVAAMLDHFVGLTLGMRMAAEKNPMQGAPKADADTLPADWRTRLPAQLDALVAAWREPGAWDGETEAGGVRMPASSHGSGRAQRGAGARLGPRRRHGAAVPRRPGVDRGVPGARAPVRGGPGDARPDLRPRRPRAGRRPGDGPAARAHRPRSGLGTREPRPVHADPACTGRPTAQTVSGTRRWASESSNSATSVISMPISRVKPSRRDFAWSAARAMASRLS